MNIGSVISRRVALFIPALFVALSLLALSGCSKEPSGTYEANVMGAKWGLEFKSGHKVHMTMGDGTTTATSEDADYTIDGDKITVKAASEPQPIVLTMKGDVLEGTNGGITIKFTKK